MILRTQFLFFVLLISEKNLQKHAVLIYICVHGWNCISIRNDTDLVLYSELINRSPNCARTHLHRAAYIGYIGFLTSISQPAALQFAISISSLHHHNALKRPFGFTDFSLSLSPFNFWHICLLFIPASLPSLPPPLQHPCFLKLCVWNLRDFPHPSTLQLTHGLIQPFPLLRDFTPVYPSHFWQ